MIDLLPALLSTPPSEPAPPSVPGARAVAGVDFGQTLGAFLDARDAAAGPGNVPAVDVSGPTCGVPQRQALADDGEDLPDAPSPDTAAAMPLPACAFALPPVAVPPATPTRIIDSPPPPPPPPPLPVERPATVALATPTAAAAIAAHPPITPPPPARAEQPAPVPPPGPAQFTVAVAAPVRSAVAGAAALPATAASGNGQNVAANAPVPATDLRPTAGPPPAAPVMQVSAIAQPARHVFAAAIAAASRWLERPVRPDSDAAPPAIPTPEAVYRPAVVATTAAQDTPLDLGTERGLQQAIDRIATLRDAVNDAADARDTRIRLVPDALGTVDIAVRKQGAQVHVHFTAEREATQALLVEAQPRLTELAAARGIRLAETSVSTGTLPQHGGSQPGGSPNQQPRTPVIPRAPASVETARDFTTDHRLA